MEYRETFLHENVYLGMEYFPTSAKHQMKDGVFEIFQDMNDAYKIGHVYVQAIDEITKNSSEDDILDYILRKNSLENDPLLFVICFSFLSYRNSNEKNPDSDVGDFLKNYCESISEILEAQDISVSDIHENAIEASHSLKRALLASKMNGDNPNFINSLEKIHKLVAFTVSATFLVLYMLDSE